MPRAINPAGSYLVTIPFSASTKETPGFAALIRLCSCTRSGCLCSVAWLVKTTLLTNPGEGNQGGFIQFRYVKVTDQPFRDIPVLIFIPSHCVLLIKIKRKSTIKKSSSESKRINLDSIHRIN